MNTRKKRALTGFTLILVYVLGFLLFWFVSFTKVVVSGNSMNPTYKSGDVVWACRAYFLIGGIREGNVIVSHGDGPGEYLIKRVHRRGGEVVDPKWISLEILMTTGVADYVVPADHYYVIGDNYTESEDSRTFGPIPASEVIGKVVSLEPWALMLSVIPVLGILFVAILWKPPGSNGELTETS